MSLRGALLGLSSIVAIACAHHMAAGETMPAASADAMGRRAATRGGVELGCSVDQLRVQSLGANGYRVIGCGQMRSYTCVPSGSCAPDSEITAAPPVEINPQATASGDAPIVACLSEHTSVLISATVRGDGSLADARLASDASTDEGGCIARALASYRAAPDAPRGHVELRFSASPQ